MKEKNCVVAVTRRPLELLFAMLLALYCALAPPKASSEDETGLDPIDKVTKRQSPTTIAQADPKKRSREEGQHRFFPLLPLFDEEIPDSESRPEASRHDCRKTLKALSGSGVTCPDTAADLLQTYLSSFVRSGFIPAPQLVAHPSPH